MSILIYKDLGVSILCVNALIEMFSTHYEIKLVDSNFIIKESLSNYKCLIIPGGADLPYCEKLNGEGNNKIKSFVSNGGLYIGICAGAYYASKNIDFRGDGYTIKESRELDFFDGTAIGSIPSLTNDNYYSENSKSKSVIDIDFLGEKVQVFYHGGSYFEGNTASTLGHYENGLKAFIVGRYKKGEYILSGVHFEIERDVYKRHIKEDESTDLKLENDIMAKLESSDRSVILNYIMSKLEQK